MILRWYFYERSTLIKNGYHCWQVPSFKPLLSQFEPNQFNISQVAVSGRSEKSEFRVLTKHYLLRGKTLLKTKAKLDKYYSDSAPSYRINQKWLTEFRCGFTSTETIPSPGRPNEITAPEMINKIHDIVLNEPKVKLREIAEIISISTERVVNILHTHLCMKNLCARWVSRLLTIVQKRIRVTTSKQNLTYFNRSPKEFFALFCDNRYSGIAWRVKTVG